MTNSSRFIIAASLLFSIPFASTGMAATAQVTVTDAWMRALPSSIPSGGYFNLHNDGPRQITLIGARSPGCGMLMLHKSENTGGLARMEDVGSVDVPAGGTVKFAPGGYHLMCMEAKPAIKPGATIPVTLLFKDNSSIEATFAVRNASGK